VKRPARDQGEEDKGKAGLRENTLSAKRSQFFEVFQLVEWLNGKGVRSQIAPFSQLASFC